MVAIQQLNLSLLFKRSLKALVVILFGSITDPVLLFTVVPVILLLALPKQRTWSIIVFNNLFLFFFVRSVMTDPSWGRPLQQDSALLPLLFGFVLSRLLVVGLLRYREQILRWIRFDIAILMLPVFLYLGFSATANPYYMAFFIFFMASFFYFLYMWFDFQNKFTLVEMLKSLNPFWHMRFAMPVPANLSLVPDEFDHIDRVQKDGLKMLTWLLPLSALVVMFANLAGASPLMESLGRAWWTSGFSYKPESLMSRTDLWFSTVLGFIINMSKIWITYGFQIAIARMCGFHLESIVLNPFKAKSFYDFYARINVYYTKLLVELFVIPISRILTKFLSLRQATGVSFFLGIFIGGVYFHFFGSWKVGAKFSQSVAEYLLVCLPYFLTIGAVIGVTMHFRNRFKLPELIRIPCYFLTAMIIALMFRQYLTAEPLWGVSLIGRLFFVEF